MRSLRSLPLFAVANALLCSTALMAQNSIPAVRITSPIDESQRITLKGTVHPLANAANDRGAAPDNMALERMHLVLKRSDSQETALRQLIGEMHTPGSANYHKWLTPDQFGKQFGPSDQDIATVEAWLNGHGFSVTKVNPGKLTLEFTGSVAQFRSSFHVQIHKYVVNGETHYANAGDPQIPAALAPVVGGFVSLNNFRLKHYTHVLGKAEYDPKTDKATPEWTMGPGSPAYQDNFVLSPGDYAVQYDLNPLYSAGVNGAGQTIAIVNESNINVGLVNQFRTLFGLPANPPQVIIDGNDPGVDGINNPDGPNYASVEAYLDVEWSGAVAPDATIDLVIGADTALEEGLILAGEHAVYANVAPIISLSFGQCEASLGTSNAFLSQLYEQAAAQGITVLVSTGDNGSAGCDDDNSQEYAVDGLNVSGFASTPYNVAVGGTDFYYSAWNLGDTAIDSQLATYWNTTASNNTPTVSINASNAPIPEQPWNDSQYGLNIWSTYTQSGNTETSMAAGSGGSSSVYTTKPVWQTGFGDTARDLPDVSLFAANGNNDSYYPICATDGDCQPVSSSGTVQIYGVGGTSASTPSFAGMMALVNQKYGRQGQADFVLYPLSKQFPQSFRSVTVGTNAVPCAVGSTNCISVTNPITVAITESDGATIDVTEGEIGTGSTPDYNAVAGYNLATGLGTVDANQLVTNWGSVTFAKTGTTLTVSPTTTITHGATVTLSGNVTAASGTPTGDVALMTDSTEPVQQGQTFFTLTGSGSYSGTTTTLPGGSYNLWTNYGGDANNAASTSTKVPITVNPESSGIFFQAISPQGSVSAGQTVSGSIDYGTQMLLSAQVAPSTQLTALENCQNNNVGCANVSFTMPTGTVTFSDSGSALNTAAINAEGDAEYNAPFAVGSHAVTVNYAGDNSYSASTASAINFTVAKDTPSFNLYAPIATSNNQLINGSGQPTVMTVVLENGAQNTYASSSAIYPVPVAPPTGSVTVSGFPSGVPTSATLSPIVDGSTGSVGSVATFTIPASTATGNYNVTFNYAGDSNYTAITPEQGTIPVVGTSGLASTISATMSGSISPNSTITVTGTVTGQSGHAAPSSSTSSGTGVEVYASGFTLGVVQFSSSSGDASNFSFTLSSQVLLQGSNFITLQYSGDTNYAPSAVILNSGSLIANPLSDFTLVPQTTIVPVTAGSSGTDTINLASVNGFSGNVSLSCTAAAGITCSVSPTAGLSSGGSATATLTVNAPADTANQTYNVLITGKDPTGEYVHTLGVTAVVTGSPAGATSFALSNSGNLTLDAGINTGNTSTLTVTPVGGFTGTVDLSCSVSGPSGATSPATCGLASPSVASGSGTDVLTVTTTSTTTSGVYTVTVTGTGTSTATGAAITATTTVTANIGTPNYGFTPAPPSITISAPGGSGTTTVTITPTNGFTGTVSLSCVVTTSINSPNDLPTCSVPASVAITGSTAGTAMLTVNTTAATTSMNGTQKLFWPSAGGAVLALVFLFGIPKRRRNWMTMVGLLVLLVSVAGLGCGGGGGSNGGGGGSGNSGTTTGAYTVTVTGTSGSITQTVAVSLTVN
jgi:hypothetical protein